jgi:hypothetical protein
MPRQIIIIIASGMTSPEASFNILLIPRNTIAPYLRGNIFVSNGLNGDNLSDAPNFSLSPGITMNK